MSIEETEKYFASLNDDDKGDTSEESREQEQNSHESYMYENAPEREP